MTTFFREGTALINIADAFIGVPWTFTPEGKDYGMTMEHLGFIPTFVNTLDERSASEQIDANYQHGGGWRKTSAKWSMDPATHAITYDCGEDEPDETYLPLAEAKLRDERIFFYDCAWTAIVQPDGTFEISRLD